MWKDPHLPHISCKADGSPAQGGTFRQRESFSAGMEAMSFSSPPGVIPKGVDGQPLVGNTADETMTSASLPSPSSELP